MSSINTDTNTIICPHCQKEFPLNDALTHQLKNQYKKDFDEQLNQEKIRLWKVAQEKALEKITAEKNTELKLLQEELKVKSQKLQISETEELNLRKLKNQLEEEKRVFELEKQRQLDAERGKIRNEVTKILSEEHQFKDAEKEKLINDMKKTIDDLKRKSEQGSQQLQGEVLELEIEDLLKNEFPFDEIKPVSKGIHGADITQIIHDQTGKNCGIITWESKRTKAWSDSWISKLKEDQRLIKADIAVLVTQILPRDMKYFGEKDGIYICDYQSIIGIAKLLRASLIQLSLTKYGQIGKKEKMEVIWNYLSGSEFKHKIEAIVEAFSTMKSDLDREKRAYTKLWSLREKQIQQVLDNTIGLHGDLQGLMGASLPEIKELELSETSNIQEELFEK